eukprot:528850-Amphidinium_carterae.1
MSMKGLVPQLSIISGRQLEGEASLLGQALTSATAIRSVGSSDSTMKWKTSAPAGVALVTSEHSPLLQRLIFILKGFSPSGAVAAGGGVLIETLWETLAVRSELHEQWNDCLDGSPKPGAWTGSSISKS